MKFFPMLHFTTMRHSHWHAKKYQHSHTVSFPCLPLLFSSVLHITRRVNFGLTLCGVFEEHLSWLFIQVNRIGVMMGTGCQ